MKVEGPGAAKGAAKTRKKGSVSGSDASFGDFITAGASQAAPAVATQSIVNVDALLTVQGAEDPTQRAARRRMRERASNILQELDKIRLSMLSGTLTIGQMINIADVVASHREKVMDPGLTAIMDEIDLRAQVELAKLQMALNRQNTA